MQLLCIAFGFQVWAPGFLCAADALPNASDPLEGPPEQHTPHGQTSGQHDAVTCANPSGGPRDGSATTHAPRDSGTSGTDSKKKRDGTSVDEHQQTKRHKSRSDSQTDMSDGLALVANDGEFWPEGKSDRQLTGEHDGQHKSNGQLYRQHKSSGQLNRQHRGQQKTDGQHSGQQTPHGQHDGQQTPDGQHSGQQQTDGQHNGQNKIGAQRSKHTEASGNRQLGTAGRSHPHTQPVSEVKPHSAANSKATSDSALDSEIKEDDEEVRDMGPDSMQLANIDIAAADGLTLSLEMLQGLQAGFQARLSLYATETMTADKRRLKEIQEAKPRYRKPSVVFL